MGAWLEAHRAKREAARPNSEGRTSSRAVLAASSTHRFDGYAMSHPGQSAQSAEGQGLGLTPHCRARRRHHETVQLLSRRQPR